MTTLKQTTTRRWLRQTAALALLLAAAACSEQQESAAPAGIGADGAIRQVAVGVDCGTAQAGGDIAVRTAHGGSAGSEAPAVGGQTRAVTAGTGSIGDKERNTAFKTGDLIYLHMPGALVRPGAAYTVSSTTTAEPAVATEPVVCPNDGADHTVYAYYPYERGQVAVTDNTHSFSVQQDQTGADGYSRSDLMYATATVDGSAADLARPTLTFAHQMSKLILRPYNTNTGAEVKVRRLTLVSGYRTVALQMPECAQGALSDQISTQQPLTVYNNAMDTALPDEAGTPAYICLVPPQTLRQNAPFVRLETTGGVVMTYQLNAQNTLQQGQAYQLDLPVSPVSMTVDIAQWTPVSWTYNTDWTETSHVKQFSVGGVAFNMRYVEGGAYTMTTNTAYLSGTSPNTTMGDQTTQTTATLTGKADDYYIGETPVTQDLWYAVMGSGEWGTGATNPNQPMGNVTIGEIIDNGATSFIAKLNTATATTRPAGYVFTLPTEVQWQYAAQGGRYSRGTAYPGSATADDVSWHNGNSGGTQHDVATKAPNELGLYDMAGSIWEACRDGYEALTANQTYTDRYVQASSEVEGGRHVVRGGSYTGYSPTFGLCRARHRSGTPSTRYSWQGLRLALVNSVPVEYDSTNPAAFFSTNFDTAPAYPKTKMTADYDSGGADNNENSYLNINRSDGEIDFDGHTVLPGFMLKGDEEGKTLTLKNGTVRLLDANSQAPSKEYKGTIELINMNVTDAVWVDAHQFVIHSGTYNKVFNDQMKGSTRTYGVTIYGGNFTTFTNYPNHSLLKAGQYLIYGGNYAFNPGARSDVTIASGYKVVDQGEGQTYRYTVQPQ